MNEAYWSGDKSNEGKIKSLITDDDKTHSRREKASPKQAITVLLPSMHEPLLRSEVALQQSLRSRQPSFQILYEGVLGPLVQSLCLSKHERSTIFQTVPSLGCTRKTLRPL